MRHALESAPLAADLGGHAIAYAEHGQANRWCWCTARCRPALLEAADGPAGQALPRAGALAAPLLARAGRRGRRVSIAEHAGAIRRRSSSAWRAARAPGRPFARRARRAGGRPAAAGSGPQPDPGRTRPAPARPRRRARRLPPARAGADPRRQDGRGAGALHRAPSPAPTPGAAWCPGSRTWCATTRPRCWAHGRRGHTRAGRGRTACAARPCRW